MTTCARSACRLWSAWPLASAERLATGASLCARHARAGASEQLGRDIRNVLHIIDLIAGDAKSATEARLGAFDDGGIGARLVRSVARVLAQHATLERKGVLTLQTLFFEERDWTAPHATPMWRALRDADRKVALDAMKRVVQMTEARIDDGGPRRETDASDKAFLNALQQQCLASNTKAKS
jgi:hypothetical protein